MCECACAVSLNDIGGRKGTLLFPPEYTKAYLSNHYCISLNYGSVDRLHEKTRYHTDRLLNQLLAS